MQADLERYFVTLGYSLLAGCGLLFLRVILAILLRNRLAPGLVPDLHKAGKPDSMSRFIALIGMGGAVRDTLGTRRLPATFGLKAVFWGVCVLLIYVLPSMEPSGGGIGYLVLAAVLYLAIQVSVYEISFDRNTVTLPRWWMGRTTRRWGDLDAAVDRQGWYIDFHFHDGTVIRAYKYVVGYAELREAARKAMRET